MNKKKLIASGVIGFLLLLIPACAFLTPKANDTAVEPTKAAEPQNQAAGKPTDLPAAAEPAKADSNFPLPKGAKIITSTPEMVIASTNLKMADAIEFYRKDAKAKGFTEKDILTTITDNVFSMAFTRPNEEKELVIQGTVIAADNLTLSLRYEETDVK
jgi:hypothetical protein